MTVETMGLECEPGGWESELVNRKPKCDRDEVGCRMINANIMKYFKEHDFLHKSKGLLIKM